MGSKIACIGTGTIGHSWATLFAWKGYKVNIYDENKEVVNRALDLIKANLINLCGIERLSKDNAEEAFKRINVCDNLKDALNDAWYVQESIFESYELKKPLFAEMDELTDKDVILASSTSGLVMSEIQKAVKIHPERCIIVHPWNPPHLMPLIEVAPSKITSKDVISKTIEFMKALDKKPVLLKKESFGLIGNRLCAALWREAIDLVSKGIASIEDIDDVIKYGPSLRWLIMGEFLTYHLGGGLGGIRYFMEGSIGKGFREWMKDLATWHEYPEGSVDKIEEQVKNSSRVKDKDYKELTSWRDKKLSWLIKMMKQSKDW